MTRLANRPLPKDILRCIARLMHLHHQTHPDRLAERFGVTPYYCRKVWGEMTLDDQLTLREALKVFIDQPDTKLSAVLQQRVAL